MFRKIKYFIWLIQISLWGYSSVGRAPALHAGGQEFESPYLHHLNLIQLNSKKYFWSNRKERKADALAHGGEEGRKQAKTTSICNKS